MVIYIASCIGIKGGRGGGGMERRSVTMSTDGRHKLPHKALGLNRQAAIPLLEGLNGQQTPKY